MRCQDVIARALRIVCLLALGAGLLAGCHSSPTHPSNPEQWPLLLITLDTLRADHLGAYGYSRPTSPALDTFAETATLFQDVTCSMPTTLPLTPDHPHRTVTGSARRHPQWNGSGAGPGIDL